MSGFIDIDSGIFIQQIYDDQQVLIDREVAENVKLKAEVERLTKIIHVAAGLISTSPEWADKHPQDCLDWVMSFDKEVSDE